MTLARDTLRMEKAHALLTAATGSAILLLLTWHALWALVMLATSAYFGWEFGKQVIPTEAGA